MLSWCFAVAQVLSMRRGMGIAGRDYFVILLAGTLLNLLGIGCRKNNFSKKKGEGRGRVA